MDGIRLSSLKRIARRSGVQQMQATILKYMQCLTGDFVDAACRTALLYTHSGDSENHRRVTVSKADAHLALRHMNCAMYG